MNPRNRLVARRGEDDNSDQEDSGPSWWSIGLGVAAGVATVAGGIYLLNQLGESQAQQREQEHKNEQEIDNNQEDEAFCTDNITMDNISDAVSRLEIVASPSVNNLNSLLNDIHVRYLAIKKEEFAVRYKVINNVFSKIHGSMKAVDAYYKQYTSRLLFRPEGFEMYNLIRLPINIHEHYQNPEDSDIIIEPQPARFVQLRGGIQYRNIVGRHREDSMINSTAYLWLDSSNYILSTKFISWFQSVLHRAINNLLGTVTIDGCEYKITLSIKEGSFILWITNASGFRCDIVLVPALKFPEERWLGRSEGYRDIPPSCNVDYWMVIPKPQKFGVNRSGENRSWQVDMYEQEKKFIHNSFHLRQGIRLLKRLCDAQRMSHVEKYHIQTLFLWKCETFEKSFWQRDVATVFKTMLREFYEALLERKISFFWKKSHNLIENSPVDVLKGYAAKLETLSKGLECDSNYMMAARYLLTDTEYAEYENSY